MVYLYEKIILSAFIVSISLLSKWDMESKYYTDPPPTQNVFWWLRIGDIVGLSLLMIHCMTFVLMAAEDLIELLFHDCIQSTSLFYPIVYTMHQSRKLHFFCICWGAIIWWALSVRDAVARLCTEHCAPIGYDYLLWFCSMMGLCLLFVTWSIAALINLIQCTRHCCCMTVTSPQMRSTTTLKRRVY